MKKVRCKGCKRLIAVEDGKLVKHRTGRSPSHCVAVKKGPQTGTHRCLKAVDKAKVKPVCSMTGKQA